MNCTSGVRCLCDWSVRFVWVFFCFHRGSYSLHAVFLRGAGRAAASGRWENCGVKLSSEDHTFASEGRAKPWATAGDGDGAGNGATEAAGGSSDASKAGKKNRKFRSIVQSGHMLFRNSFSRVGLCYPGGTASWSLGTSRAPYVPAGSARARRLSRAGGPL